jgi:hypothetical protein
MVWAIVRGLVFANRTVGSHPDLVYAYDRDMRHKSALQRRFARAVGQRTFSRWRKGGTCRPAQELLSGPGIVDSLPSLGRDFVEVIV